MDQYLQNKNVKRSNSLN